MLGVRDCTCQSFQQMQHHSLNPRVRPLVLFSFMYPSPTHLTSPTPQCKHLLAVRLAPFLDRLEELEVNDDLYESYVGLG